VQKQNYVFTEVEMLSPKVLQAELKELPQQLHTRLDYGNFVLVGLPPYQQRHIESVLNAAARLVYRLRRYNHITDALAALHWLRLPERVDFKVAVTAVRVLHGLAPPYLNQLTRVADLPGRRRLRSSSSQLLQVPPFRRSTVGRRSFPVAAAVLWNSLPLDIQSSPSLPIFRQQLHFFSVNPSRTFYYDIFVLTVQAFVDSVIV